MSALGRLQTAVDKERKLKVIYFGGSNPGGIRELTPISIDEDEWRFQAICHISNEVKTFRVADTKVLETAQSWEPKPSKLSVIFAEFKSRLELAGWFALAGIMGLGLLAVGIFVLWIVYKIVFV